VGLMKGQVTAVWLLSAALCALAHEPYPFDRYPAAKIFRGNPATPRLDTPRAREYRTRIRAGAKQGSNFAGHYTVVSWGCGTSCAIYVILDARTGQVYWPPEISRGVELNVASPEFRLDSTLMIVASCPPPEIYGYSNCNRNYYKWDGSRLVLLQTEPVSGPE
jgi:hypothetical protein